MDSLGGKIRDELLKKMRWIALGVALLLFVFTSYYQIEPEEIGLVTRFGRYVRSSQPGPHLKLAFGMERVIKVPTQRQLKEEFGFRTTRADVRSEFENPTQEAAAESTMLTGDLNVATVEWIVQYKIRDPYKYLFRVRNVTTTFRDMSEAVMRQVIGDRSVTEVLTIGREDIQVAAREELQTLVDRYELGVEVQQLVLQDVNPPAAVRNSFNEVNQAIQEKERAINQAMGEYNKAIPEARGRAKQTIQAGEGYAAERVNHARGDVQQFIAVEQEYAKAPQVTRTRLHLEALSEALPAAKHRVLLDSSLKGILPLLPLGKSVD